MQDLQLKLKVFSLKKMPFPSYRISKILFLKRDFYFFLLLTLLTLPFLSCATSNFSQKPEDFYKRREQVIPNNVSWTPIENLPFAQYFFFQNKELPVRYHCIKIDLTSPNLKLLSHPVSEADFIYRDKNKNNYFYGLSPWEFSQKYEYGISINTSPFQIRDNKPKIHSYFTRYRKNLGIHTFNGIKLGQNVEKYSAITFNKKENGYRGKIYKSQRDIIDNECDYAFGGFYTILEDYKEESFKIEKYDSRTALGLDEKGENLFILVAEGEEKIKSVGLSYPECARILLKLGACDALEMDGGHSASLYINRKNILPYTCSVSLASFLAFTKQ